eukprot:gene5856-9684_t
MSIPLPRSDEFDVTITSNKKLNSTILHFSAHYLIEFVEEKRIEQILTEHWTKEENKWILRRHVILDNVSVDPYHYFVFLVSGPKETNFTFDVNNKKVEYKTSENEALLCGLMYKTKNRCEMRFVEEMSLPYHNQKVDLEKFVKKIHELLDIGEVPKFSHSRKFFLNKETFFTVPSKIKDLKAEMKWDIVAQQFLINTQCSFFTSTGKLLGTCSNEEKRCLKHGSDRTLQYGIRSIDGKSYDLKLDIIKETCSILVFSSIIHPNNMTYLRVKKSTMNLISTKEPISRMKLSQNANRSMIWCALIYTKNGWIFQSIDVGHESNDFSKLLPVICENVFEQIENHLKQ